MLVFGIDPGLVKTGWGMVETCVNGELKYVNSGLIKVNPKEQLEKRIRYIHESILHLITLYGPSEIAMEEVFVNMNAKTSEKLIMARSAIFTAVASRGYTVHGYKPNKVKKSITGNGFANKETVKRMVNAILRQDISAETLDVLDALAVAICHCNHRMA